MSHPTDKQLLRSQDRTVLFADMLQIILEAAYYLLLQHA